MSSPAELDKIKHGAIDTARRGASQGWLALAEMAVLRAMTAKPAGFTTDDVWAELEKDGSSGHTPEPRALGSVMRDMAVRGVIAATDTYRPSMRAACHRRPVRVWTAR